METTHFLPFFQGTFCSSTSYNPCRLQSMSPAALDLPPTAVSRSTRRSSHQPGPSFRRRRPSAVLVQGARRGAGSQQQRSDRRSRPCPQRPSSEEVGNASCSIRSSPGKPRTAPRFSWRRWIMNATPEP